jgi:outer membrane protein OmpA-like peptidoglycan-associated protein
MRTYALLLGLALLAACSPKTQPSSAANAASQAGQRVAPPAPVALTPGSSIAAPAAATVGMVVMGEIKPGGASNFYRFDNPDKLRDVVLVRLENRSTTLRPDIKLYNADRSQLSEKYDGTSGASVEQAISLEPGQTIYVEVLPYSSAGAYQLSALPQHAFDANEANDNVLGATPLKFGGAIEGSVMDDKDADWFHVSAATAAKVSIVLENQSSTLRPDIKVFSASKSQLIEKYDGTPAADLDFTVDVEPGRDFYVEIVPYGSTGKYRLSTRPAVQAADMAAALKNKGLVDLYGVYFDVDQTSIKPASATTLAEVGALLKGDNTLHLEVSGHTDNSGAKAHNLELSQGRAEAVVAWLIGQYGVDPTRLVAKGYGDTRPVVPNDTPDDMAKNRRVELRRI